MNEELTGKCRFRIQRRLFRRNFFVLQVGCSCRDEVYDGGSIEIRRWMDWRDARPEDLTFTHEFTAGIQVSRL